MKTAEGISFGRFRRSCSWRNDGERTVCERSLPLSARLSFGFSSPENGPAGSPFALPQPSACSRFRSVRIAPGKRAGESGRLPFDRSPVPVRFPRQMLRRFGLPFPNPAAVVCDRGPCMSACFLCPSLRGHKMPSGKRDDTTSRYFGICIRAPVVRFSRLGNRRPENGFGRPTSRTRRFSGHWSAGRSALPEEK